MKSSPLTQSPFLRFLLSGGFATLCHWCVFFLLAQLDLTPLYATSIGAVVGAVVNYLLQYYFAFQSSKSHQQTLLNYVWVASLSFLLNALFFYLIDSLVLLPHMAVQVLTTAIVTLINYVLYKKVVFYAPKS